MPHTCSRRLTAFMQVINSSYPHPNHTLINAGRAAASLAVFNTLGCLEQHLPDTLDLLILENVAGWTGGVDVRGALRLTLGLGKGARLGSCTRVQRRSVPKAEPRLLSALFPTRSARCSCGA